MTRSRISVGLTTLAVALVMASCSEQPKDRQLTEPMQASVQTDNIIAVQNRHTPELMGRDGIIGTGIRHAGGTESIVVYAVSPGHAANARVPAQLEGYDVEVVVTGRIDATDYNNPQTKQRPAPNGFSVGHPAITAGTIGARVKKSDGSIYILSNNHVLANVNEASIGDATLQPGPYDGGTAADQIGTLADFQPIVLGGPNNSIDAAIARVSNGVDLLGTTPTWAYGAPGTTPVNATLNMPVQKFGRTTGHTHGTITETNVTVSVCYVPRGPYSCSGAATFTGQVGITPGSFSGGGDSGSLIVTDNASKSPVALLFAGSTARTLGNPIAPVLSRFGVTIDVTNDGGTTPPPGEDTTAPNAAISVSCSNTTCSFTDASTDNVGVTGWNWNLGNGATATTKNTSTTYAGAGTYNVTLTVTDAAGNTDAVARAVNCSKKGKNVKCS